MNHPFGSDEYFMQQAIVLARQAYDEDEIPVGAVVVCDNRVVARGYNQTEKLHDVTAHAEMLALTAAFNHFGAKYLPDCTLYVTLEPCTMCAGALYWSQIGRVVYGASDEKRGYSRLAGSGSVLHPRTQVATGILAETCGQLVKDFFRRLRE